MREHPIEVARRALKEAAEVELARGDKDGRTWANLLLGMASTLPPRDPVPDAVALPENVVSLSSAR